MAHAFLDELLSDSRPVVERLLEEPAIPLRALVAALDAFDACWVKDTALPAR